MAKHRFGRRFLFRPQLTGKRNIQRNTFEAFVAKNRLDLQVLKKAPHIINAPARQSEMEGCSFAQWMILGLS